MRVGRRLTSFEERKKISKGLRVNLRLAGTRTGVRSGDAAYSEHLT
jgi:hypothetical protein